MSPTAFVHYFFSHANPTKKSKWTYTHFERLYVSYHEPISEEYYGLTLILSQNRQWVYLMVFFLQIHRK